MADAASARSQIRQLRSLGVGALRNPLYRSGYALIANVVGTTVVGIGYWAVAAHFYSREQVGQASALVAALVVVSNFAQLNLAYTLPRFLPRAGRRAGRLISYGYGASSATALVIGVAFIIVLPRLSPQWHYLASSAQLSIGFVAAAVVWGIFALQDAALLGLHRPSIVPIENFVYGVAKLLVLFALISLLPRTGVFIAWIIPLAINVPAVNWLIFHRYVPRSENSGAVATVEPREIIGFTMVDYVGNVLNQSAGNLLPLLVLTVLGASANASFYVAWTVTTGLSLLALSFATSLLVEGSARPDKLAELTKGVTLRTLVVTVSGAAVLGLGSHLVLAIYGHGYAARAAVLLGLLAAGSVFYGLLAIVFSIDRIVGRVGRATATRLGMAVVTLAGSWLLLRRMGINGVGVAWLAGNFVIAMVRVPTIVSAMRSGVPARRSTGSPTQPATTSLGPWPGTSRPGRHRRDS